MGLATFAGYLGLDARDGGLTTDPWAVIAAVVVVLFGPAVLSSIWPRR